MADILSDDADGTCVAATMVVHGFLTRVATDPEATAPTADWDFTLADISGADILGGEGADHHTSTSETFLPKVDGTAAYARVDGTLTLACTNMGNAKNALIYFYFVE
jgi:hypothetical protein